MIMENTNNNTNLTKIEKCVDYAKTTVKFKYYIDENGLKQGLFESFYENGNPFIKCTFKDNRLDSLYEEFYENGQLEIRYTCKDGIYDGLYEEFYENGKLRERCTYKNGLRQGLFESFYKDGQVKERCTYKNDQLITKSEILIQALISFFLKIIHSLA